MFTWTGRVNLYLEPINDAKSWSRNNRIDELGCNHGDSNYDLELPVAG